MSSNLSQRHPILYDISVPNFLVNLLTGMEVKSPGNKNEKKIEPLTVSQQKLLNYTIHLSYQSEQPNQIEFDVPYKIIFSASSLESGNIRTMVEQIQGSMVNRFLYLDTTAAQVIYKDKEMRGASMPIFKLIKYYPKFFRVTLNNEYVDALKMLKEYGFTKGDFATLMTFNHQWSFPLYWKIRQWQSQNKTKVVGLDELKKMIYITDSYPVWGDFERYVLKKMQNDDFNGKWSEFTYKKVKEGNKVKAIEFSFAKGPRDEKDLPVGQGYKWETTLQQYGVLDNCTRLIRHFVKSGQANEIGLPWTEEYVRLSIEGFRLEFVKKKNNARRKNIKSPGAYLYQGLVKGYWINYVSENKLNPDIPQKDLFAPEMNTPKASSQELMPAPVKERESQEQIIASWKELYNDISQSDRTAYDSFDQFMVSMGHHLLNGNWEKK